MNSHFTYVISDANAFGPPTLPPPPPTQGATQGAVTQGPVTQGAVL